MDFLLSAEYLSGVHSHTPPLSNNYFSSVRKPVLLYHAGESHWVKYEVLVEIFLFNKVEKGYTQVFVKRCFEQTLCAHKLLAMNVHSKTFLIDRETFNSPWLSWH